MVIRAWLQSDAEPAITVAAPMVEEIHGKGSILLPGPGILLAIEDIVLHDGVYSDEDSNTSGDDYFNYPREMEVWFEPGWEYGVTDMEALLSCSGPNNPASGVAYNSCDLMCGNTVRQSCIYCGITFCWS